MIIDITEDYSGECTLYAKTLQGNYRRLTCLNAEEILTRNQYEKFLSGVTRFKVARELIMAYCI